ncbi:hypothetical protein E3N86_12920 [Cryobacterium sp. Hz7]|uniref:benzoate/H(+) symporter BenE family transporter n=1 Tax=Cryobacterium sp. Hz7 TaxID=1259166 RepID=UPI00106B9E84|nr:benzoate/H(+) symporter BenE family transporter [Cryobacterium sp. Hz7]TFB58624.1 hypothetical protein E3N86_12920 [Cryobacterium sp. Hz7]
MLAGILFPICPAPVTAAVQQPLLAVPVVLVWLAAGKPARAWMVPATMAVAAIIDVRLPASALRDLVGSGLANAVGSVVGALGITLTAITTAPMAGPDAHPDGPKRWIATAASGAACLVLVTASGVSVLGIGSAFGGWSSAAWSCSGSAGCPPAALTHCRRCPLTNSTEILPKSGLHGPKAAGFRKISVELVQGRGVRAPGRAGQGRAGPGSAGRC